MKNTKKTKSPEAKPKTRETKGDDWNFGSVKRKKFKETPAFNMYVYGKSY